MLTELETEIISAIRAAPVAAFLRAIDALPDLTPDVVKRIATLAPAVYVVAGDFNMDDNAVDVSFELLCFARHAAGSTQARRGDATAIGLYPIMDALAFYFDSLPTASAIWHAKKGRFLRQSAWAGAGISPGVITLSARVMPDKIGLDNLGEFLTFHGDYDIEPFASSAEHDKWLQEPADYTASSPDLTDSMTLQE